jgi:hypothetical protein
MIKRQRQTIQWSKDKDKQYNDQKTKTNNTMVKRQKQTIIYNTLQRQINSELHEAIKTGCELGCIIWNIILQSVLFIMLS